MINNKGELKLADFGLARIYDQNAKGLTNRVITIWYKVMNRVGFLFVVVFCLFVFFLFFLLFLSYSICSFFFALYSTLFRHQFSFMRMSLLSYF